MTTLAGIELLLTNTIALEVTGLAPLIQVEFDVSTQVTAFPLSGKHENEGLLLPWLEPLTFHWYMGVEPPFIGTAVKKTSEPGQNGFVNVEIETFTGIAVFTDMVRGRDVAGLP